MTAAVPSPLLATTARPARVRTATLTGATPDATQQALAIAPHHTAIRVTLANVYLAAGLALNARRELETAAQLAPQDDTIRAMMNRLGSRG